jgi:hypothetical protein
MPTDFLLKSQQKRKLILRSGPKCVKISRIAREIHALNALAP